MFKIKIENYEKINSICFSTSMINLSYYMSCKPETINNCLVVLSENIASGINLELLDNYLIVSSKYKLGLLKRLSYKIGIRDKLLDILHDVIRKVDFVYGTDHGGFYFLYKNKPMVIFEDGDGNYRYKSIGKVKQIYNLFFGFNNLPFGFGNHVVELHVLKPSCIKRKVSKKCSIIPIDLNESIRVARRINLSEYSKTFSGSGILITQPLSEDRLVTESEKVNIYKEIVEKYKLSHIKPHPRELTDYSSIAKVIPKKIPVEVIFDDDYNCPLVVTLFSTAVDSIEEQNKNIKVIKLGSYGILSLSSFLGEKK